MVENEKLLEIKNLSIRFTTEYSEVYAVNGVDLIIRNGESVGLVGESGAGKTTTALASLNLLPSNATVGGDILYKGKSVRTMSIKELRALRGDKISMIFQNPLTALNPVFTVGEQISMVLRAHTNLTRKEAKKKTQELLQMVGIEGWRYNDYPNQFSGGMRQRVGIAASLACNPELLIADEPTTALDVTIQAQVLELMRELKNKYSTGLLMITHNLGIIAELCQKVAVMYAGSIIEYGTVKEVYTNPSHPYTKGLLNAIPKLDGERTRLEAIEGRVADPQDLPDGCRFHPRCKEKCCDKCQCEYPAMVQINEDHYVACHNFC